MRLHFGVKTERMGRLMGVRRPLRPTAAAAAGCLAALVRQWAEAQLRDPQQAQDLYARLLELVEPPLLEAALASYQGQCAAAARRLGLHRTTLRKKLDQYGVEGK